MYFIGFLFFRPLCWVFIAAWVFSICDVQASHCGGFSCGRVQALGQVGFSSCGMQSQFPHGTWDLLGQGIEPVFLALAGGLLTTGPPGKSKVILDTPTSKFIFHYFPLQLWLLSP